MISFFVHGIPKAQPRPRRSKNGGVYTPDTAEAWKEAIILQSARHRPREPLTGPLEVSIDFFLPRPRALMRKADPDGPVWAPVKPDRDNLDKAVLDALTEAGFWTDDARACAGQPRKLYHAKSGPWSVPGARISIEHLYPYSIAP